MMTKGMLSTVYTSILKEQTNFYTTLFTSEGCNQHAADSLLSNIIVRLSDGESENLERNDKHRTTEQSHQTF